MRTSTIWRAFQLQPCEVDQPFVKCKKEVSNAKTRFFTCRKTSSKQPALQEQKTLKKAELDTCKAEILQHHQNVAYIETILLGKTHDEAREVADQVQDPYQTESTSKGTVDSSEASPSSSETESTQTEGEAEKKKRWKKKKKKRRTWRLSQRLPKWSCLQKARMM